MNYLPKIEEILLLAIWKLRDNAYGTTIIDQVEKDTGSSWVSGSVYSALTRLKNHGYVAVVKSKKNAEQTGRPRIYYELTEYGQKKLAAAQKVSMTMWNGVPKLEEGK
ncbi:MAG: PadR family transcriptional regulator [bacterium]|nr:PadR family transcriptional regulator [bacterium]